MSCALSFFNEVDKILGTHYSRSHGRKKLGTKRLLASMCQLANLHTLGVLIIDEVQNLNEARSGGAEKMHNFFVSLVKHHRCSDHSGRHPPGQQVLPAHVPGCSAGLRVGQHPLG